MKQLKQFEQLKQDFSWQACVAGLIAVIVGYAGPTVLIFQVALNANLTTSQVVSWLWSYSIASGVIGIITSLRYKMPLIYAWSTPGIAFLITAMVDVPFSDAIGAFIISNILITLIGAFGWLKRLLQWLPLTLTSALNAGILIAFALAIMPSLKTEPLIVGSMAATYFIVRFITARWAVAAVLIVGIVASLLLGKFDTSQVSLLLAHPELTWPTFSMHATINIAIPLTVLALTGQYLPGFAVMKTLGYKPPVDRIVSYCGIGSIIVAPFGAHNINPSAIIAAIVASDEAHQDKSKRYIAGVSAGVFYIIFGLFAATFVSLITSLSSAVIATLAGLALLSAIAAAFDNAFSQHAGKLAPTAVFVISASGVSILGIGSAFWAIVVGIALHHFLEQDKPKSVPNFETALKT